MSDEQRDESLSGDGVPDPPGVGHLHLHLIPPPPGPPPTPSVAAADGGPKRWSLHPIAALAILLVTLLIGIGIGAASGSSDKKDATVAAVDTSTSTTSTAPPTTTTTRPPTTTTTLPPATPESVGGLFPAGFESSRSKVLDVLTSMTDIETVDSFIYDPAKQAVTLAVTSRWASPENQVDGAWSISRAIATLWQQPDGAMTTRLVQPKFTLVNSGTRYTCPAETMTALADS